MIYRDLKSLLPMINNNFIEIDSISNPKIKEIKKLQDKKYRKDTNTFLIEGIRFIEEAVRQRAQIITLIFDRSKENLINTVNLVSDYNNEINIISSTSKVLSSITGTENTQGIAAVVRKIDVHMELKKPFILYLDRIQDPGNLGTIIRSCHAFNVKQLILSSGCVDVYSDKVLRASMGSIFNIDIFVDNKDRSVLKSLINTGYEMYLTEFENAVALKETIFNEKSVIVIGNEANGVGEDLKNIPHKSILIPMPGGAESLNAAVAASCILYEFSR